MFNPINTFPSRVLPAGFHCHDTFAFLSTSNAELPPAATSSFPTPTTADIVNFDNSGRQIFSAPTTNAEHSSSISFPDFTPKFDRILPTSGFSTPTTSEIINFDRSGHQNLTDYTPSIYRTSSFSLSASFTLVDSMPRERSSPVDNDSDAQAAPRRVKAEKMKAVKIKREKEPAGAFTFSLTPEEKTQTSYSSAETLQFSSVKRAFTIEDDTGTQGAAKRVKKSRAPVYSSPPLGPYHSSTEILRAASGRKKRNAPEVDTEIKDEDGEDMFYSLRSELPKAQQTPDSKKENLKLSSSTSSYLTSRRSRDFSEQDYHVNDPSIYSGSSSGEENENPFLDREDLEDILTREKARRLATAVKVPDDSNMSEEETNLYLGLALRGIKPVMSFTWSKDFNTLPESLFAVPDNSDYQEERLPFHTHKGTDFAAIRAFRELLEVGGFVRDCRLLTLEPQVVIRRSVKKYVRWAISDAALRVTSKSLPVHVIYTQKSDQMALSAVHGLSKKMESLANRHRQLHTESYKGKLLRGAKRLASRARSKELEPLQYWPTLVGFLICGPILSIVSLDTNPNSVTWIKDSESRVKYLGQFDMSEVDQDVWNSLAIAIAVISMRKTMSSLADTYEGPLIPRLRRHGDDTDDDDL
ncbi:hypothetical protein N7448_003437 [Penicillium atrosanguineum]|uniref:Uncharacterized protein n=1 Tax=Penicillium atrosanguineum TaxID=1132637 RepID=A0A9W9H973_9EURO|nr:hypothetical protein N7448_003437 [Penicillium atrosanguineum]KAJ5315462.1 hypothetical protein N7476_005769 [Penicillium atrosanguineum]